MRRPTTSFPVLVLLLCLSLSTALADTLYLKDGRTFEGKLVSEGEGTVRFRTAGGVLTFPRSQVDRVERSRTPADEYEERRAKIAGDDVGALLELAAWCREQKLFRQRRRVLGKILELCPDHPEARRESGQIHRDGRWVRAPKGLEAPSVAAGDRVDIPDTRASLVLPKGWKVELGSGKATATGPARYKVPPVLTVELGGAEGSPGEAFPEKEGWEKPREAKAGGMAGLRSRRPYVVGRIGRVEALAILSGKPRGARIRLTTLALESGAFGKALDLALRSLEIQAPPADYTNEHYGYALNLPKPASEWAHQEDDEHDLLVEHKGPQITDFAKLMVITGNPGQEREAVQKWFDGILSQMRTTGDMAKDEPITLAGETGRFVDGTYLEGGVPYRTRMVLLTHGKRLFWIVFHQHEFGQEKTSSAWDVLLDTFRFTK